MKIKIHAKNESNTPLRNTLETFVIHIAELFWVLSRSNGQNMFMKE